LRDDAIDKFNALRRVQASAGTISSWDPMVRQQA
jgi:hypothetical protein